MIGRDAIKRACEEALINAVKLPSGQWRIGETALDEFINGHKGVLNLKALPKKQKGKNPMPEGLRRYAEKMKAQKNKQS